MYNLKISVTSLDDIASARWHWSNFDQHFTAL